MIFKKDGETNTSPDSKADLQPPSVSPLGSQRSCTSLVSMDDVGGRHKIVEPSSAREKNVTRSLRTASLSSLASTMTPESRMLDTDSINLDAAHRSTDTVATTRSQITEVDGGSPSIFGSTIQESVNSLANDGAADDALAENRRYIIL